MEGRGARTVNRLGWIFAVVVSAMVLLPSARSQAPAEIPRIGILSFAAAPSGTDPDPDQGVLRGLRELGYVERLNILIERRYANGQDALLAAQAAELVNLKVRVILAGGPGPREAAKRATSTVPIITVSGSDPVREGWAQSLAHPGGNITGFTVTFPGLDLKRLELLKQAFPGIVRVGIVTEFHKQDVMQNLEAGARQLGLQLHVLEVRGRSEFDAAFKLARQQGVQALVVVATNIIVAHRSQLAELSISERLPSMSEFPVLAQAGFLMTYGADLDELGRLSVIQMDKILKGARPGDLPIEQPKKFYLTVNLKTAKALGIAIPQSLLLRADEVIQ